MSGTVGSYGSPLKYLAAAADSSSSSARRPEVSACTCVCTSMATSASRSSSRLMDGDATRLGECRLVVVSTASRERQVDSRRRPLWTTTGSAARIGNDAAVPVSPRRPPPLHGRAFRGSAVVASGLLPPGELRGPAWRRLFRDVYA